MYSSFYRGRGLVNDGYEVVCLSGNSQYYQYYNYKVFSVYVGLTSYMCSGKLISVERRFGEGVEIVYYGIK